MLCIDITSYGVFCRYYLHTIQQKPKINRFKDSSLGTTTFADDEKTNQSQQNTNNKSNKFKQNEQNNQNQTSQQTETSVDTISDQKYQKFQQFYQGLLQQYKITAVSLILCMINVTINTIYHNQNYKLTWIFMIDIMLTVTVNFLAFHDSQELILKYINICRDKAAQFSVICVDIICCMFCVNREDSSSHDDRDSENSHDHDYSNKYNDTTGESTALTRDKQT